MTTLFNRLRDSRQISPEQAEAGEAFAALRFEAGCPVTADDAVAQSLDRIHRESDAFRPAATPAESYRQTCRALGPRAALLESLCRGHHPGVAYIASIRSTLDALAKILSIGRDHPLQRYVTVDEDS